VTKLTAPPARVGRNRHRTDMSGLDAFAQRARAFRRAGARRDARDGFWTSGERAVSSRSGALGRGASGWVLDDDGQVHSGPGDWIRYRVLGLLRTNLGSRTFDGWASLPVSLVMKLTTNSRSTAPSGVPKKPRGYPRHGDKGIATGDESHEGGDPGAGGSRVCDDNDRQRNEEQTRRLPESR